METHLLAQQLADAVALGMLLSALTGIAAAVMSWSFIDLLREIIWSARATRRRRARARRMVRDAHVDVIPTGDRWS